MEFVGGDINKRITGKYPHMMEMVLADGIYELPDDSDLELYFEAYEIKKDWARLKFRVYNTIHENGGFLVDVIVAGNLDELFYQLRPIARFHKKQYGPLRTIQRKINNKVPVSKQYKEMKKKLKKS